MAHFNAAENGQVIWDTSCVFYYHNSLTILNNVLLFILLVINNKYLEFILLKASLIEFFLFKISFLDSEGRHGKVYWSLRSRSLCRPCWIGYVLFLEGHNTNSYKLR